MIPNMIGFVNWLELKDHAKNFPNASCTLATAKHGQTDFDLYNGPQCEKTRLQGFVSNEGTDNLHICAV